VIVDALCFFSRFEKPFAKMRTSFSHILAVMALTAVGLTALPAHAQYPDLSQPPSMASGGEGDLAVIVAVEDYLTLPDAPGTRQNAEDWAALFRDGYGIDKVRMLLDQNATREEMKVFAERAAEDVE
jgi:predicted amidohydrolase